jgi:hypothetical protein
VLCAVTAPTALVRQQIWPYIPVMSRYFFHVQNGSDVLQDPDGQEFSDLAVAKEEAAAAARDLMSECLRVGEPLGLHRKIVIEDEQGLTVASVTFPRLCPRKAKEALMFVRFVAKDLDVDGILTQRPSATCSLWLGSSKPSRSETCWSRAKLQSGCFSSRQLGKLEPKQVLKLPRPCAATMFAQVVKDRLQVGKRFGSQVGRTIRRLFVQY